MQKLLTGSALAMAGLLTISCSDEGAGPLGPDLGSTDSGAADDGPAGAPATTGEMRIVLPGPGARVSTTAGFLLGVEQQVHPSGSPAYGVVEITTAQHDWMAIREFQWSAQATEFSVALAPDLAPGSFRLRVAVRDAASGQILLASDELELTSFGPTRTESAVGDPDRPDRRQRDVALAPAAPDAWWRRAEGVMPDAGRDTWPRREQAVLDEREGSVPVLREAMAAEALR